jgi:hypothetical protein
MQVAFNLQQPEPFSSSSNVSTVEINLKIGGDLPTSTEVVLFFAFYNYNLTENRKKYETNKYIINIKIVNCSNKVTLQILRKIGKKIAIKIN